MLRRLSGLLVAGLLVVSLFAGTTRAQEGGQVPLEPPAKAWLLADAATGDVLAALNHREPLLIASLSKVMTGLVALEHLDVDATIAVSALAAGQPAMRIGMDAGEQWLLRDTLHALLIVSANDAAYAIAEASGGSVEGFADQMRQAAERMGMRESTFLDPAGFDGPEGFGGGSRASAYDLAILARNALTQPEISAISALRRHELTGPDGTPHTLVNHNRMLEQYEGATGLKTGYTRAAGHTLIATAERDGRTLIAVVLGSDDHYGVARDLLNQGFATPSEAAGVGETLPEVALPTGEAADEAAGASDEEAGGSGGGIAWSTHLRRLLTGALGLLAVVVVLRRRAVKRRRARRLARRRAHEDARRRGMLDVVSGAEYYHGPSPPTAPGDGRHVSVLREPNDPWRPARPPRPAPPRERTF